jgi:hypothetical protein
MAKRTVTRRGKPSKSGSKKRSKKTPAPAKKRPVRRPIPTRSTHHKSSTAATLRRREARELALLIHEQELAARREARREAREALELERLIEEQQEAERQAEREVKLAHRRERTAQLRRKGYPEKKVKKLVRLEEFFERESEKEQRKDERRREREAEQLKETRLREWAELADASRAKRGKTKAERAKARKEDRAAVKEAAAQPSIERYITESLWEVYNCLGNLGFKVDQPQCWHYQDGSFDAQIRVNDPDDTTGQDAILELEKCIKPIVGAYIALGFRHYPSLQTERRVEKKDIDGKYLHGSLRHMEMGQYTNLTNYRLAGSSEIADHINATHKWLGDFSRQNQAWCSQIMVRYYHSPDGKAPHEGEHDRINEGGNPGETC